MKRHFFTILFCMAGSLAWSQSGNEVARDQAWLAKNPMAYRMDMRGQVPPVSDEVLGVFRSYEPGSKTLEPMVDIEKDLKAIHPISVAINAGLASAVPRLLGFGIDPNGNTGKFESIISDWSGSVQDCAKSSVLGFAVAYYVEYFLVRPWMEKAVPGAPPLPAARSGAKDVLDAVCALAKRDRNTNGMMASVKLLNSAASFGSTAELREIIFACARVGVPKRVVVPVYSFRPRTLADGSVVMEGYQLSEAEVETIPPSLLGPTESQVRDQWWLRSR
jgi:hypothetical protein